MIWLVKGVAVALTSYLAIHFLDKKIRSAEESLIQQALKKPFLEGDK